MALTKAQAAQAVAFIETQTKRVAELKEILVQSEMQYAEAWEQYGSELGPDTQSSLLRVSIETCEAQLKLINRCVFGELDISDSHYSRISNEIAWHCSQLDEWREAQSEIESARSLLSHQ